MRRYLFAIFSIFGLFMLAGVLYQVGSVLIARHETPGMVKKILGSGQIKLRSSELTQRQKDILLKVEDPGFYQHNGVDFVTPGAGLTTVSQAVVKKLYFKEFRPGISKVRQTLVARFAFDPLVPKEDQLTLFINLAWFRQGVTGMPSAAEFYYGKQVSGLSEDEFISLVAMLIAPRTFDIKDRPASNAERVRRIKMLLSGAYTPKGLMDQYYGTLTVEEQAGLAPASYFP
jgi:membrane carboxypeptidase/penicillin-binding protein